MHMLLPPCERRTLCGWASVHLPPGHAPDSEVGDEVVAGALNLKVRSSDAPLVFGRLTARTMEIQCSIWHPSIDERIARWRLSATHFWLSARSFGSTGKSGSWSWPTTG